MLHHILKLIFRNLLRFKTTFFINLTGLSSGLACAFLIYLWISDELNFDKFHKNDPTLFQVMENQITSSGIVTREATPIGMSYVLGETMPEVEYAATVTPMAWFPKLIIEHEGTRIKNEGKFVGKDFFQIFSFDLAYGNSDLAFQDVNSIVISEDLARSLFGSIVNAGGKTIPWMLGDIERESVVTAVFKSLPSNSSEQFDLLLNIDLLGQIMNFSKDDLMSLGPSTFLMLKPGTDIKSFNSKVTQMMANRTGNNQSEYFVTKYSDKYLHGEFENGIQTGGRIEYVRLFALIGLIILLVGCINFMNLATAKASRRIKDVGIKKVMGAWRRNLVVEYLGESILISFFSLGVSLVLVAILLPSFNDITGKQLGLNFSSGSLTVFFIATFVTGIVAGSYPALYLSGFNPAAVLRGKLKSSLGEIWTRKGWSFFSLPYP